MTDELSTTIVERVGRAIGEVEKEARHTYSWERADDDWRDLCCYRATKALQAARYAELVAERDAAVATLEDEEAAHADTLRLWNDAKTRNAELVAALKEARHFVAKAVIDGFPASRNPFVAKKLERIDALLKSAGEAGA